ncbi:MAG: hypothetical protein ABJI60_16445 [Kangiellaceae bacterium]
MLIGDIIRGFPQQGSLPSPREFGNSLGQPTVQRTEDLSLIGTEAEDIARAIKHAVNDSILHKLFSAIARSNQGLFEGYNDNPVSLDSHSSEFSDSSFQESLNFDFSQSINQSFEFDLSISNNSFSLDVSFSREQTRQISFSDTENGVAFSVNETFIESFSLSLDISFGEVEQADPLILDLDFNGFEFASTEQTIAFDLDADGQIDSLTPLEGQDAFLAIDLNKNGQIDNGLELFGDAGGAKDGFAALQRYDDNNDQLINAQDRVFNELLLLQFSDNNEQQISKLNEQEVESLSLNSNEKSVDFLHGNQLTSVSNFIKTTGEQGVIGDFLLGLRS